MTISIYSISFNEPLPAAVFDMLKTSLPADIREKAEMFRRWQDAHACVLGKHLLLEALRAEGFSRDLADLQYSDYGRPYFEDGPDFNISHAGNRVVCILSDTYRVGIDLEEEKNIDIGDFRDQFSTREWEDITTASYPLGKFYQYWTAKESLIKADGRGLNIPIAGLQMEGRTVVQLEARPWFIKRIDLFPRYACHIATAIPVEGISLKEFTPAQFLVSQP